jgi:hypothetical protein
VSTTYQKPPEHLIALPGDPLAGVTLTGLVLAGHETQIGSYRAAFLKPPRILQSQHEGKRGQRSYSWHLPEQSGLLRVALFADPLYALVVVSYPLGERADGRHHVFESFSEFMGQLILCDLFVEALG